MTKFQSYEHKALAAFQYVLLHKKQLSAALAFGAAILEVIQKAQ